MRKGKLNENEIRLALEGIVCRNREVLFGAGVGEDCAVIKCDSKILLTTDPITGECDNIEELAVNINANDIYASGGEPFAGLMTVIAPPNESVDKVIAIIKKTAELARQKGIDIVGGHTEFSDAVVRTIVSMTMLGRVDKPINNSPDIGDKLIVTKYLGIEATKILLSLNANKYNLTDDEKLQAQNIDLSVEKESKIVKTLYGITAMHDITEGGLYGASCEIVKHKGLGVKIFKSTLPVLSATVKICDIEKFDIGYTISSGSMLITCKDEKLVLDALKDAGINAVVVGEVTKNSCVAVDGEKIYSLESRCDELFK